MKRSNILIGTGITAVLIAAGIWLFYHWGYAPWSANGSWGALHQGWNGPGYMMGYGGTGTMMGFGGMGIFGLLFWGLVIFLIVSLIVEAFRRPVDSRVTRPYDALEILKQRYARGEIDKQQFKTLLQDLKE